MSSGGFFQRLMEVHPVLPLVVESGDVKRDEDLILNTYLHSRAGATDTMIPLSLIEFYQNYLETFFRWRSDKECDQKDNITELLGLFQQNENNSASNTDVQYKLTEPGVQKYLVALNLAKTIAAAWNSEWLPSNTKQLTFFFRRTAVGQARFWEMWGVLFSELVNTAQKDLFDECMDIMHGVIKKVDISRSEICVAFASIVYECGNQNNLCADYSDSYLPNQTIRIDGKEIKFFKQYCLSYILLAVGYLLKNLRSVHSLTLSNLGITAQHLHHMLSTASGSVVPHTLQVLDLSHNPLGYTGLKLLQSFLVKATSLTHLNLTNCDLEPRAMVALSRVIECMPLVSLNLSRNNIGDDGISALVEKWRNCYCLSEVDLSCNNITDTGAVTIGSHLKELLNLRFLRLLGNEIIGDGLYSIYRGVDELENHPVPNGHLPREDTSREFTCAIHLEICTVQTKRKYDRNQMNVKLRVPKSEEDEAILNEPPEETNTYIGYDTVDGGVITCGETELTGSIRRPRGLPEARLLSQSRGLSELCRHESLLVTSTPMRTPTKTGQSVASILDSQPRTPVRRRWSTLPQDLTGDISACTVTPAWQGAATLPFRRRLAHLDSSAVERCATIGALDRSGVVEHRGGAMMSALDRSSIGSVDRAVGAIDRGGIDRSATFNGINRSTISVLAPNQRRSLALERTPSMRVVGRKPSVCRGQWDRERRLHKIWSKPLFDRSVLDNTVHGRSAMSFMGGFPTQ